jgi:triosephosphate isomerase
MGNWKMSLGQTQATSLAREIVRRLSTLNAGPEIVLCPSHLHVTGVKSVLEGSVVQCGAQDVASQPAGAVTGGVGADQLRELGVAYALVAHSERRSYFREDDADAAEKLRAALRAGIVPVLCFGETREQREAGQTDQVVHTQLHGALSGLEAGQLAGLILAYEPVWAIGTGLNAAVEDAEAVHLLARGILTELGGQETAAKVRILYGGSVKPENAAGYLEQPNIDGALVGGASLDAAGFIEIVRYRGA